MNDIEVKAIKITIPILASELPTTCIPPEGQKVLPIKITLKCGDITMSATLNGKSYKKAVSNAQPGSMAIIQGRLGPGNEILDAGITIMPPKAEPVSAG